MVPDKNRPLLKSTTAKNITNTAKVAPFTTRRKTSSTLLIEKLAT